MNRQEIEAAVMSVLTTVLRCEIRRESSRKDYHQWDSLKHIEVIFAIEDELNIRFSEDILARLDSVQSIVDSALSATHHEA